MKSEPDLHAIRVSPCDMRANLFTETELAAAELLVQLSESTNSGDSSSSTTSSPRSVNTWRSPVGGEEEGEGMVGPPRRTKRYRMISDLYKSTISIGGGEEVKKKNKKRQREEEEEERGVAVL